MLTQGIQADLSRLTSSSWPLQADLFKPTSSSRPIRTGLFWLSCPLSQMPCPLSRLCCHGCTAAGCPVLVVMFQLSCSCSAALFLFPVLSSTAVLPRLFCPSCSFWAALPGHSCPTVLSLLSCSDHPVLMSCPRCPMLNVLSWLSYTGNPACCPVLAIRGCPYMAAWKLKNW